MRYGVPYKGSKNGIAEWVVSIFPKRANFYDLFAGGCAVTHCAMLNRKFKSYTINDIEDVPQLFLDAVNGKLKNEKRWISREDFFALKDKDAYIRYCWSFGNNGRTYLYSREVEPWKKALHYARVLGDYSLLREFGIETDDASRINVKRNEKEWKEKYIEWYCKEVLHSDLDTVKLRIHLEEKIKKNSEELRQYLIDGLKKSGKRASDVDRYLGTKGMAGHYFGKSQWEFPTRDVYIKLQNFIYLPRNYEEIYGLQELLQSLQSLESLESLQSLQSLESLESLQRLQSLQSLQSLESLQRLEKYQGSYDAIKIKPDSVIYCDIPYRNTDGYQDTVFDYEAFYAWCEKQTEPVFISEYWMPEDRFVCVAEKEKSVMLCSGGGKKKTVEKIFMPKHQAQSFNPAQKEKQLEFDFMIKLF